MATLPDWFTGDKDRSEKWYEHKPAVIEEKYLVGLQYTM